MAKVKTGSTSSTHDYNKKKYKKTAQGDSRQTKRPNRKKK